MSDSHDQDQEDRTGLDGFEIEIFKLVKQEATSKQWKEWLRAPLERAAAKGNMKLFTRLMGAGADGSSGWRGCHGRTLLGSAAHGRSELMVVALLNAGAKPDLDVKFGANCESALHVAVAQGAQAVSAALMLAGADPELRDGKERTPLHVAAKAGRDVIVRELLLKGASPNVKTRNEHTPLHLAAEGGHALCVSRLLLGGADMDSRNDKNLTPLHLAARNNQLCAMKKLLDAGGNVNGRGGPWSVLDVAADARHVDVVKELLRRGGDVKASDIDGGTALHCSVMPDGYNGGVVRALLAAGADTEAKTTEMFGDIEVGSRPLHSAVDRRKSSRGTVRALLEGGADVNALNKVYQTPLHVACRESNVVGVELLLQWGADEKRRDENAHTAADLMEPHRSRQRISDDQRIQHMLARAPADRSWRRRGWLVLCRFHPTKVQLSTKSSCGSSSVKVAKASCNSKRGEDSAGNHVFDFGDLVGRVVGLEADGVFRSVVGFL